MYVDGVARSNQASLLELCSWLNDIISRTLKKRENCTYIAVSRKFCFKQRAKRSDFSSLRQRRWIRRGPYLPYFSINLLNPGIESLIVLLDTQYASLMYPGHPNPVPGTIRIFSSSLAASENAMSSPFGAFMKR